jgi:hypothetical protein
LESTNKRREEKRRGGGRGRDGVFFYLYFHLTYIFYRTLYDMTSKDIQAIALHAKLAGNDHDDEKSFDAAAYGKSSLTHIFFRYVVQ